MDDGGPRRRGHGAQLLLVTDVAACVLPVGFVADAVLAGTLGGDIAAGRETGAFGDVAAGREAPLGAG